MVWVEGASVDEDWDWYGVKNRISNLDRDYRQRALV